MMSYITYILFWGEGLCPFWFRFSGVHIGTRPLGHDHSLKTALITSFTNIHNTFIENIINPYSIHRLHPSLPEVDPAWIEFSGQCMRPGSARSKGHKLSRLPSDRAKAAGGRKPCREPFSIATELRAGPRWMRRCRRRVIDVWNAMKWKLRWADSPGNRW